MPKVNPTVAIVIPMMDRAAELRKTLPAILRQGFDSFEVYIVDCGSRDDLAEVFAEFSDPRLNLIGIPRPRFFSYSQARNAGARYSSSDLILFLDGDCRLAGPDVLSISVDRVLQSGVLEHDWFQRWRLECAYEPLPKVQPTLAGRYRAAFGHGLASVLLVERPVFQTLGGFNELLEGWGYEDTDMVGRLELSGFGRVALTGFHSVSQANEEVLRRRNFRNRNTRSTWSRNRALSDALIKLRGPAFAASRFPGRADAVERRSHHPQPVPVFEQEWDAGAICLSGGDIEAAASMAAAAPLGLERFADLAPTELPLVSVVVPSKNSVGTIRETIESILSQSYPNIECLVVDAASDDGTLEVLAGYGNRLRWLSRPDNGAFDAINEGWAACSGDILAWLNADDVWEPDAVSTAVGHFLQSPKTDVVYGHCGGIDERGHMVAFFPAQAWSLSTAVINCDHIINQAASFMRRRIIDKVGGVYPAWCHDHDLWLRIAMAGGGFAAIDSQLASARIRPQNLGNVPAIVIPGKVGLTERFFSRADLPEDLAKEHRAAMSNAYLRCLYYVPLNLRTFPTACWLVWKALRWHPLSVFRRVPSLLHGLIGRAKPPRIGRRRRDASRSAVTEYMAPQEAPAVVASRDKSARIQPDFSLPAIDPGNGEERADRRD